MVSSSPRLKSAEVGELLAEFCGAASQSKREAELYQQLGNLDTGESRLIFDVKVERGKERAIPGEPPPPPPGEIWRGSMPFSIRIVDTLAESIPPRSGETVDAGVRDSIGIEICDLTFDERMQRTARLVLKPDPAQFPSVASTALSLTVEVLKEGQVVESTRLVATCRELPSVSKHGIPVTRREIGSLVLRSIPASVETDDSVRAKYRLRITGTDKDVIREWDAARWWSGSLTMPLTEVCERESRRAGPSAR
jgi:hypothetical protein